MRRLKLTVCISLALIATGCATQTEQANKPQEREQLGQVVEAKTEADKAAELEAVTVTGSRIRRVDTGTADAVQVISREEIESSGAAVVADMAAPVAAPQSVMAPPPASPVFSSRALPMANQTINTEKYAEVKTNPIQITAENPVSTFSIDVDTGSYSNVRRMLMAGQRPPTDSIRVEEMINYFDYRYESPKSGNTPFSVTTEFGAAPWNGDRQLLLIGVQGKRADFSSAPPSNLVFLIDTSGSMQDEDKLPLLKKSFSKLVNNLREQDRVSIVVYAGSAGLVLPSTSGANKGEILSALDQLDAGGSTNGGAGIELAYKMARDNFIKGGINRVVLATDGDFNVGTVSQNALETMVSDQRESGVSLTTLGFGQGNYNDELSERLADLGNGNHAYIDSLREAEKVLSTELGSTLQTIAKDVKIQIEFNPAVVAEYRLIGYENRMLRREDFNNDKIDAGEIGAGHDVTALYEITLVDAKKRSVDPLRFEVKQPNKNTGGELAWLKMRYKQPEGSKSQLIERAITKQSQSTQRLYWAAAVAAYADRLRGGTHTGEFAWNDINALAHKSRSKNDAFGNQAEFIELIGKAQAVTKANGGDTVSMSE